MFSVNFFKNENYSKFESLFIQLKFKINNLDDFDIQIYNSFYYIKIHIYESKNNKFKLIFNYNTLHQNENYIGIIKYINFYDNDTFTQDIFVLTKSILDYYNINVVIHNIFKTTEEIDINEIKTLFNHDLYYLGYVYISEHIRSYKSGTSIKNKYKDPCVSNGMNKIDVFFMIKGDEIMPISFLFYNRHYFDNYIMRLCNGIMAIKSSYLFDVIILEAMGFMSNSIGVYDVSYKRYSNELFCKIKPNNKRVIDNLLIYNNKLSTRNIKSVIFKVSKLLQLDGVIIRESKKYLYGLRSLCIKYYGNYKIRSFLINEKNQILFIQ